MNKQREDDYEIMGRQCGKIPQDLVRSLNRVGIAPFGGKNMGYYVINQSVFCAVIMGRETL